MHSPLRSLFPICLLLITGPLLGGTEEALTGGPDPERFANALAAFAQEDAANPPPKGAVVCTGSSSMRLWHPRLKQDLAGLTVIPRGFGGSHFSDVIHYVEELILNYEPRAVLIYEGDNDANFGKSPERIFGDFKTLVEHCRKQLPELRFYVISAKPSVSRWSIADRMQAGNRMIEAYCKANEGFTFIDVWPALTDSEGVADPELFVDDMLHLNEAGYERWVETIAPVVLRGEAAFE
jgi:lysophospholipase L1-like esterase